MKTIDQNSAIAILGGKGMLGTDLAVALTQAGYAKVQPMDISDVDITDQKALEQVFQNYPVVINCAAYTAVDQAETDLELATAINAQAPKNMGLFAQKYQNRLIHFSTDFVFAGSGDQPYSETDPTGPLSVYGQTKLDGESALLEAYPQALVLRIQWTYGIHGNNFISKIVELAHKLPELKVIDDQWGAPTSTASIAQATVKLLADPKATGLFHLTAQGFCNRFQVAKTIINVLKLETSVQPCGSDQFPTPAQRPLNSRLNSSKIQQLLPDLPHWEVDLKDYLERHYQNR